MKKHVQVDRLKFLLYEPLRWELGCQLSDVMYNQLWMQLVDKLYDQLDSL